MRIVSVIPNVVMCASKGVLLMPEIGQSSGTRFTVSESTISTRLAGRITISHRVQNYKSRTRALIGGILPALWSISL